MRTKSRPKALTAKMLCRFYPHQDLLPIDPPTARESMASFKRRIMENDGCGDGLFEFLVREMADVADDPSAIEQRLDSAIADLRAVRAGVAKAFDRPDSHVDVQITTYNDGREGVAEYEQLGHIARMDLHDRGRIILIGPGQDTPSYPDCPDLHIERREGYWSIQITPEYGADPIASLRLNDDHSGRIEQDRWPRQGVVMEWASDREDEVA